MNIKKLLVLTVGATLLTTPFYASTTNAASAKKEEVKCYTAKDQKDTIFFKKNKTQDDWKFGFGHKSKEYGSQGVSEIGGSSTTGERHGTSHNSGTSTNVGTSTSSGESYGSATSESSGTSTSVGTSTSSGQSYGSATGESSGTSNSIGTGTYYGENSGECKNILVKIGSKELLEEGYYYKNENLTVAPYFNKDVAMISIDAIDYNFIDNKLYNSKTSELTFTDTVGNKVVLKVNSSKAKINGKTVTLSRPVVLTNNSMMIPITLLNTLGAKVAYYPEYKAFEIAMKTASHGISHSEGHSENQGTSQSKSK